MSTSGGRSRFPTRQYSYRRTDAFAGDAVAEPAMELAAGLYQFILGRDSVPRPMPPDAAASNLGDPFARLLLREGIFPLTLREVLAALDAANASVSGVPTQKVFIVADGGQIRWSAETSHVDRQMRLVVSRGVAGKTPTVFISTSTEIESATTFLQVLAWDEHNGIYHWYERRGPAWVWAGNSWDALSPDSRGYGPFDSHVNGSINMKELKAPWIHWHSENAAIPMESFDPDDSFLASDLFAARVGARTFEIEVARPGIARWNESRFQRLSSSGRLERFPEFLRQVVETTTINLISSSEQSSQLGAGTKFFVPMTFFVDADALFDDLGIPANVAPIQIDGGDYLECLRRFEVALRDDNVGFAQPGDAFFVWVTPERALEDQVILQKLLELRVLSPRFAACLLMVDFPNPIFSVRRAQLLKYAPLSAGLGGGADVEQAFLGAIQQADAAAHPDSPEREFISNWEVPETKWQAAFARRIEAYFSHLKTAAADPGRVQELFGLLDSRRREFRRRPLAEFGLTVPVSNRPADMPFLEMTIDGRVRPRKKL
jgi:hypothetical protein